MNPFTLYYDPEYFCDRKTELKQLTEDIQNSRNVLLHSPRRLGKSALIKHFFYSLEKEKKYDTLFVDLFATSNMEDFIKMFAEKLLLKYHQKNFLNGVKTLLKGINPNITFSPDGMPKLGLNINEVQQESTLKELFHFLEHRKKPVVVAFDEFQEVAGYPGKAEALLRTYIQSLSNIRFIFSGSSNHLLQQMFFSARRPFYQSSEVLVLDKINRNTYAKFIKNNFEKFHRKVSDEAISYLLDFSDVYTYYTQSVCNQVFSKAQKKLMYDDVVKITTALIESRKADYQSLLRLLTENQKRLMIAIAKENIIEKPASIDFIIKHKLPSASSVSQALKSLVEKEILYRTNQGYTVYDIFLKRFMQMYY